MIRLATPADADAIHAIYAPIVRDTPISFEWEVPSVAEMRARIDNILTAGRPWLVWDTGSAVMGYVYATSFRERAAYQWGTEVSVYIREDARGQGLGRRLYTALFEVLRLQGYCMAIAGATVPNEATELLHRGLGFVEFGRLRSAGYKFGRWHDVVFWSLQLRTPASGPQPLIPLHDIIGTTDWTNAIEKQATRA